MKNICHLQNACRFQSFCLCSWLHLPEVFSEIDAVKTFGKLHVENLGEKQVFANVQDMTPHFFEIFKTV